MLAMPMLPSVSPVLAASNMVIRGDDEERTAAGLKSTMNVAPSGSSDSLASPGEEAAAVSGVAVGAGGGVGVGGAVGVGGGVGVAVGDGVAVGEGSGVGVAVGTGSEPQAMTSNKAKNTPAITTLEMGEQFKFIIVPNSMKGKLRCSIPHFPCACASDRFFAQENRGGGVDRSEQQPYTRQTIPAALCRRNCPGIP